MEKILEILKENARTPVEQIARRLGRDEEMVRQQIRKLEDDRIILGYRAVLDPEKSGDELVMAIIEVRLTPQRDTGFDAIAQRIHKFPEVKTCYLMSGDYDLHVMVEGRSLREVAAFVSERLATIEHVSGTATHFILKKYKEFGVTIHESERMTRLAVSP
ncbi:Lrp/AsnC family transcriptional regulator [bacterium]|nr:Lrp/AsnC family transcriptional regulator [bacterium]